MLQLASLHIEFRFLAAATQLFISQYRFAVKDGRVIVAGKIGTTDAETAAVNWIVEDGEVFMGTQSQNSTGGFADALRKLH